MKKILLHTLLLIALLHNNVKAQYWTALNQGLGSGVSYERVYSICDFNQEVYAGGYFTLAGGITAKSIAKWNGTAWDSVGAGIDGSIHVLKEYDGKLYAGGQFWILDTTLTYGIAKWDGTYWSPVGNGVNDAVSSLAVYNGELYAGFGNYYSGTPPTQVINKWNGINWTDISSGLTSFSNSLLTSISCMTVYNNELYVAGEYTGFSGVAIHYAIAKWNGLSWTNVLVIPAVYTLDGAIGEILSMTVFNGNLFIAGSFFSVDNIQTKQIAKWDGANWSAVGSGINNASYPFGGDSDGASYTSVNALTVYDNELYATGRFDSCGAIATRNIAKWDGTSWSALSQGINNSGFALLSFNSDLYVGGSFNTVDGFNLINAKKIAKWRSNCSFPPPSQPSGINGNNIVCQGSSQTFTIDPVLDATSYAWVLPNGWSGYSNSTSIIATIGSSGGAIKVYAINSCGSSIAQTFQVTVNPLPDQPTYILGNTIVCASSSLTYSVAEYPGANYSWTLPQGWIGSSISNTINVTSGINGGIISVTSYNSCGSGPTVSVPVAIGQEPPGFPGSVLGDAIACENALLTYSVNSVQGANYYIWTLPTGWSGNSTTNSITVSIGQNSGDISVVAVNDCGMSAPGKISIDVKKLPTPPEPIAGNILVCSGTNQSYSIPNVPNATYYTWTLPANWSGYSNTNSISIIPGLSNGEISVIASNNCGSTTPQILQITVNTPPASPQFINGNDTVCEGSAQTYFVDPVLNTTGYNWEASFGSTTGINSNSISLNVNGTTNQIDHISVSAFNDCGNSLQTSIPVVVKTLPQISGEIIGEKKVCMSSSQTYFVNLANDATSYTWILPTGWSGNSSDNSINAIIGNAPGNISVRANNVCGAGSFKYLAILPDSIPRTPDTITGNVYVSVDNAETYFLNSVNGALGYHWSINGGGIITNGQNTSSINVQWENVGKYQLTINSYNTCGTSADKIFLIEVAERNANNPFQIQLNPNPSKGQFYLIAKRVQDKRIQIEVFNMAGQKIFGKTKIIGTNDFRQLIDLNKASPGVYAIRILIDKKIYTKQISIVR